MTAALGVSTNMTMARRLRLLFVCLALGAVAPPSARAAYAEIAAAPVATAVVAAAATDRAAVTRERPHRRNTIARTLVAPVRVALVSRRYLVLQSLLL